jgi:hypothetical protein
MMLFMAALRLRVVQLCRYGQLERCGCTARRFCSIKNESFFDRPPHGIHRNGWDRYGLVLRVDQAGAKQFQLVLFLGSGKANESDATGAIGHLRQNTVA